MSPSPDIHIYVDPTVATGPLHVHIGAPATPVAPAGATPPATPPVAPAAGTPATPPVAPAGTPPATPPVAPAAPAGTPGTPHHVGTPGHVSTNTRNLLIAAGVLAVAATAAYVYGRHGSDAEIQRDLDATRRAKFQEAGIREHLEAPAPQITVRGVAKRNGHTVTIQPSAIELKTDQCNETHPGEFEVEAVREGGNGVLLAKVKIVVRAHHKSYTYRVRGSVQASEEGMNFAQKADLVPNEDVPGIE